LGPQKKAKQTLCVAGDYTAMGVTRIFSDHFYKNLLPNSFRSRVPPAKGVKYSYCFITGEAIAFFEVVYECFWIKTTVTIFSSQSLNTGAVHFG
jgi:hypothetical protein